MSFTEWLEVGLANAWVAEGFCLTHDTPPMTPEELVECDSGLDVCIPGLRVWMDNT